MNYICYLLFAICRAFRRSFTLQVQRSVFRNPSLRFVLSTLEGF
jgi:hypothetical protein